MRRLWVILLSILVIFVAVPVPSALAASWPTLTSGTKGTDVYALQSFLQARGYSLAVDGEFGPGTLSAVKSFQTANGLTADGSVGPATWSKVTVVLQQGATGQAVKALQRELNRKHGYGLTEDGSFGPGTLSAVKSFQSAHGLTADGSVGPATWQQLIGHFEGLGASGTGWYRYSSAGNDYASANVVAQLKAVAADWAALGYGVRIGMGDSSLTHGGNFPPHQSHQNGLDTDLRCVLTSGEGQCDWRNSNYSRTRTQKLVNMLLATGQVDRILFNDPYITGVTPYSGHDNHLHVDWKR